MTWLLQRAESTSMIVFGAPWLWRPTACGNDRGQLLSAPERETGRTLRLLNSCFRRAGARAESTRLATASSSATRSVASVAGVSQYVFDSSTSGVHGCSRRNRALLSDAPQFEMLDKSVPD